MRDTFSEAHCAADMMRVRIIGMGSSCGDDRIGWDAVQALQASGLVKRFPTGAVDACCCDHPGMLLALFNDIDAAIVIDAMRGGGVVGTVTKLAARELALDHNFLSSHGISVAENIALGEALGVLPATLVVYGIEASDVAPATDPDRRVGAAIPILLRSISSNLELLFSDASRRSGCFSKQWARR